MTRTPCEFVSPKLRVLSLGAGVQSTTLALMAARGELERPDYAIFADTEWEPKAIYRHLDWLETQLPFPVKRISGGNILDHIFRSSNKTGRRFASVPWFTQNGGMGRRQCTREFKVDPLQKTQRALLDTRRASASRTAPARFGLAFRPMKCSG